MALNVISFIPQVRRMYRTKSTEHISFNLVTFTVFSAIEQASMCNIFLFIAGQERASAMLTQNSSELMGLFK